MPTITKKQTLEQCPSCGLGRLTHVREEWEPFPGEEPPKNVELNKCLLCSYELVIKDELRISGRHYYQA